MPAAPFILTAAALTGQAVMANQATQHAKGAAQAQQTAADAAAKAQGAIGPAAVPVTPQTSPAILAAQSAQRKRDALRSGIASTIGPNAPAGSTTAPVAFGAGGKTTLG